MRREKRENEKWEQRREETARQENYDERKKRGNELIQNEKERGR